MGCSAFADPIPDGDCRAWVGRGGHTRRAAVYLGLPADVAAAEALHGLVATVLATELRRYKAGNELTGATPSRRARAIRAFATGLVMRVAERLLKMKAARRAERLRSSGRDLVEQKLSLIDAELERLGLDLVSSEAGRRIPDRRAFWPGLIAGDGFDPHAWPEAEPPTGLLPPAGRPPAG